MPFSMRRCNYIPYYLLDNTSCRRKFVSDCCSCSDIIRFVNCNYLKIVNYWSFERMLCWFSSILEQHGFATGYLGVFSRYDFLKCVDLIAGI